MNSRNRPAFPLQLDGIDEEWKAFFKDQFDDLYPKIQSYLPIITGLTDGVVSGALMRMGRMWNVSITVTPSSSSSVASGAYVDLPFTVYSNVAFVVNIDATSTKSGYILKNTSRLFLPDWTSSTRVIVSGMAGE
jgi:hypothetical protein